MSKQPTQTDLSNLVAREVVYCVSSLVATLANTTPHDLNDQAIELCSPIDDYEEAATQEGWTIEGGEFTGRFVNSAEDMDGVNATPADACGWEDLCREFDIEPYQREIFEHWIVSGWLAGKLEAHGERIDRDFAGLTVWGRTATGQAIAMDAIIETIWTELHANDKVQA